MSHFVYPRFALPHRDNQLYLMEISLSLEETNKLRRQLGLREIPQGDDSVSTLQNKVSKNDLLIAETNKLRASAGLKPIPETDSKEKADDNVDTRVESRGSKLLDKLKSRRNVAHLDENEEPNENHDIVVNTDDWLNSLGKEATDTTESDSVQNVVHKDKTKDVNEVLRDLSTPMLDSKVPHILKESPNQEEKASLSGISDTAEPSEQPLKKRMAILLFDEDEIQPETVKMKKIKKKSLKNRKREQTMDPFEVKPVVLEQFEDNDDDFEVQSMINHKRRLKQQQRKKLTSEELAKEISQLELWDSKDALDRASALATASGLVFDDTSEFLSSLSTEKTEKKVDTAEPETEKEQTPKSNEQLEAHTETSEPIEEGTTPRFNTGIAATLNYLKLHSVLETKQTQQEAREQREAAKRAEMTKLNIEIESRLVREQLESDGSYKSLPKEEKETIFERYLDERLREKGLLQVAEPKRKKKYDLYTSNNNYRPQVQLVYKDKDGHELLQKEAFKHLSHKFHGAKPGKADKHKAKKTEPSERIL